MSKMGELQSKQDNDMMECMIAEEEMCYYQAVSTLASFIDNDVSMEKAINDLREVVNGKDERRYKEIM